MARKLVQNTASFIAKARAIHGDRYDYSETQFSGAKAKVTIICPKHGSFRQIARFHIRKSLPCGCLRCGQLRRSTNLLKAGAENFVKRAKAIHGDRYDYSKAVYRGALCKVTIICPEHGPFIQTAHIHTNRKLHCGCPLCGQLRAGAKSRKAANNHLHRSSDRRGSALKRKETAASRFVSKARKVHGSKYDYSETEYVSAITKSFIRCPRHGVFLQRPNHHLSGHGCPECAAARAMQMPEDVANKTQWFITKARAIHGERYDYSKVAYTRRNDKVCIICAEHGDFLQAPQHHLKAAGCWKCGVAKRNKSRRDNAEMSFVTKAHKVHGRRYGYAGVVYVSQRSRVSILCQKHGLFQQRPLSHLQGYGCTGCGREKAAKANRRRSQTAKNERK